MNYHLHENGWTVILDDFDFNQATQEDINQIAKLIAYQTCVVVRNQNIDLDKELEILNMFKNLKPVFLPTDEHFKNTAVDKDGIICRVTAELNEHGKPGLGANPGDFDWHANFTWRKDRRPIIWLYGLKGTVGSRTSWNNNVLSYNDLDPEFRDSLKDIKQVILGGTRHDGEAPPSWKEGEEEQYFPPLVYTSMAGITGLYFPFAQNEGFVGMDDASAKELRDKLTAHTMQEKYIYHHDWKDGDIVISDQWFGIHKRWYYEALEKRLLHRAAVDYPDQDYAA